MKRPGALRMLALLLLPAAALAQPAQQPPLQQQQWQRQGAADPLLWPNGPAPSAAEPDAPAPDGAPALPLAPPQPQEPFTRPNVWLPAKAARIKALDKVNAESSELMIKVGQSATYGSLTITVKACVTRPPDQPADAAAFLSVTDSHPDSDPFAGWMLAKEPSVSMMQNPVYDLRVSGCA